MAMYFSTMNSCRLSSCLIASATAEHIEHDSPTDRQTDRHTSVKVIREMCLIDGVGVGVAFLLQLRDPVRLQGVQGERADLRDVDTQAPVDPRALDANQDAQVHTEWGEWQ